MANVAGGGGGEGRGSNSSFVPFATSEEWRLRVSESALVGGRNSHDDARRAGNQKAAEARKSERGNQKAKPQARDRKPWNWNRTAGQDAEATGGKDEEEREES